MEYAYAVMNEQNASSVAKNLEPLPILPIEQVKNAPGIKIIIPAALQTPTDKFHLEFSRSMFANMAHISEKLHEDQDIGRVHRELKKCIQQVHEENGIDIQMSKTFPFLRLAMLAVCHFKALGIVWNAVRNDQTPCPAAESERTAIEVIQIHIQKMVSMTTPCSRREHKMLAPVVQAFIDWKMEKLNTMHLENQKEQKERRHEQQMTATEKRNATDDIKNNDLEDVE